MVKLVGTYLLQNGSVSIPGLGTIYIERIPAQSDFVNRQLLPPAYHYRFDKYFDAPGKEFFTFISARKNTADYEAMKLYNEWALGLRNSMSAGKPAVLEGIGSLGRDDRGEILFEPTGELQTAFVPVPANRIIRSNISHNLLVGDRETNSVDMTDYYRGVHRERESWWIYALIIAAVSLTAIFFHYYNSGPVSPFGNKQIVRPK